MEAAWHVRTEVVELKNRISQKICYGTSDSTAADRFFFLKTYQPY